MENKKPSVDEILDDVALKQFVWKNTKLLTACLMIAEKALQRGVFWPDELTFDFLLTDDDRNCIGSAWRICSKKLAIVEKTGSFRRSTGENSNGRTIFQYKLVSRPLAEAFLKRYDAEKYKALMHPQLGLGI